MSIFQILVIVAFVLAVCNLVRPALVMLCVALLLR